MGIVDDDDVYYSKGRRPREDEVWGPGRVARRSLNFLSGKLENVKRENVKANGRFRAAGVSTSAKVLENDRARRRKAEARRARRGRPVRLP